MSSDLDAEYYKIRADHRKNIEAGKLQVDEKTKLFYMPEPTENWTEWRILAYNKIRLGNQVKTLEDKESSYDPDTLHRVLHKVLEIENKIKFLEEKVDKSLERLIKIS
jgi:hypothetical protein